MEVTELILKFGLPFVAMALIVVCMVGIVKVFTKGIAKEKEVTENKKKWLAKMYMGLALLFSYVAVCVYYGAILKEPIFTVAAVRDAGIVWTITSPIYELYKQFGGRKLLVKFVSAIQSLFKGKNKNADDILSLVMSVLNEEAPLLTEVQKEAIQAKLSTNINGTKEETTEEVKEEE